MINGSASWLSLIPPIMATILVLLTKECIFSLMVGGFIGCIIYREWNLISSLDMFFEKMSTKMAENIYIILFLAFLGILVKVMEKSGGALSYGSKISKKIKTKTGAQLITVFLGILMFIDDYFNCLTVGTIMGPIFDRYKISREKLAYIIDTMAVAACVLMPISSWAAIILSTLEGSGVENSFEIFIRSIPYNFYAIFAAIMVLVIIILKIDFGPMFFYENDIINKEAKSDNVDKKGENNAKAIYLLLPIGVLIISTIIILLYNGDYFKGQVTILEALKITNSSKSLTYGALIALICSFLVTVLSGGLKFKDYMEELIEGVKSMVSTYLILILAWTIGGICQEMGTGDYVKYIVETTNVPGWILPLLIFVIAGFLSFATGTSWGAFGILIPVVVEIAKSIGENAMLIFVAAVLSGATFGDHSSPISDTCVLSSTGARCKHIDHVMSQLPYVLVVAIVCCINYITIYFIKSIVLSYLIGVVLMVIIVRLLSKKYEIKFKN